MSQELSIEFKGFHVEVGNTVGTFCEFRNGVVNRLRGDMRDASIKVLHSAFFDLLWGKHSRPEKAPLVAFNHKGLFPLVFGGVESVLQRHIDYYQEYPLHGFMAETSADETVRFMLMAMNGKMVLFYAENYQKVASKSVWHCGVGDTVFVPSQLENYEYVNRLPSKFIL